MKNIVMISLFIMAVESMASAQTQTISLNGKWQMGFARKYTSTVDVPSIATDPTKMNNNVLWYKKEVTLPDGNWTTATLKLKGARFQPTIYINGDSISKQEGGMAPIFFVINHKDMKPRKTITLEIALASLKNMSPNDASFIPWSDQFRSNISSELWDDVILHLHGRTSIYRMIPFTDFKKQKVTIQFDLNNAENFKGNIIAQIVSNNGKVLLATTKATTGAHGSVDISLKEKLKEWSPNHPNVYQLKLQIAHTNNVVTDEAVINYGVKKLEIKDKQFYLNGEHFIAKGPTVVWHRWMRTQEGRELGYDTAWFIKNIIQRTKDLGGNYLRFHLGLPPEKFLDLCDRYGLAVQFEWSFFHGMPASKESLLVQYKSWLNLAMKHPCISFIHPYNETGGEALKTVWAALDSILKAFPPLLLEDRDVLHVHKYWWSLFENLGLYYDNATQFDKAVMADEFGGNYLDNNGDLGSYSTVKETFLRFLGREHTKEQRLAFQADANSKVAEYWRRIGAAGFSPFCALGSNEDGNNWFLGALKDGYPKPVWSALSAAFSPQSISLEIWDRNFEPNQSVILPVYVFNDDNQNADLLFKVTIEDKVGKIFLTKKLVSKVPAFSKNIEQIVIRMPATSGDYTIKAELINKPSTVKYPVVSSWNCRVMKAIVPDKVKPLKVAVFADELELKTFLKNNQITTVGIDDTTVNLILTSQKTWNKIEKGDSQLSNSLQAAIMQGKSAVMLDVGDRPLGQGYPKNTKDLGPLQSVVRVSNPKSNNYNLFGGITLKFTQTAEPESHLHPAKNNRELWGNMPDYYTWLWNGYRGGLVVPASDMSFTGLGAKAFLNQWKQRGAEVNKILAGNYYSYELQGFYEFSDKLNDTIIEKKLRDKIVFLVNDAPALAISINPNSPIISTDVSKSYLDAQSGIAENLVPLANCGKNLTQTPVVCIDFGFGKGKLVISQLLTAGRLAKGFGESGFYGINMMK